MLEYAGRSVDSVEPIIDNVVLQWLQKIQKFIGDSQASTNLDIGRRVQYLTVDIISRLCLGQPFGCIENDNDQYEFLETVKQATPVSLYFTVFPELSALLFYLTKIPLLRRIIVPSTADANGLGKVMKVGFLI